MLQLAGVREDVAELPCEELDFTGFELEMGERCHGFDLRSRQYGHGKC
jgi:hypothetical protein